MISGAAETIGVVETQAGTVFGTPRYMSPEQAQGKPLDPRTDLYSLGVILFQMLTGQPPFTDNDAVVVMARHIKSVPKRPNEVNAAANVPRELEDVVMRALSKDPEQRQANAEIFASELLAALETHGAMASGVRASAVDTAVVRVPGSVRPPSTAVVPAVPVKRRATAPLVAAGALLALLAVAVAVYLRAGAGKRSPARPEPAPTGAATTMGTTTEAVSIAPPQTSPPVPTLPAPPRPPANAATSSPKAAHGRGGRPWRNPAAVTTPAAAVTTASPAQTAASPAPPPSATSNYGVFE
jgi:serine/threonine-protein kinase